MRSDVADTDLALAPSLRAPFEPGRRGWVLLAALAAFLIEALRQVLPGLPGGLLALLLTILLWLLVYRIASETLLTEASEGPGQRVLFEAPDGLAARHIGLWLLATLLLAALNVHWGLTGLLLGALVLVVVLPAATIVLTLSGSLIEALVPGRWWALLTRLGAGDALRLSGTLLLAGLAFLGVATVLVRLGVPAAAADALRTGLWCAAALAWFHLAGRAVRLHRPELGLDDVKVEPEPVAERFTLDLEPLWQQVRAHGGSKAMHAELARQLEQSGERRRQLEHGRQHVAALLLAFERPDQALLRAGRMLALDPGFVLEDLEAQFALLRAAAASGRTRLLVPLVRNYLSAWPRSVKASEARLIACEAFAEDGTAARRAAEGWYRELMTAELKPDQRQRLSRLASAYLGSGVPSGLGD